MSDRPGPTPDKGTTPDKGSPLGGGSTPTSGSTATSGSTPSGGTGSSTPRAWVVPALLFVAGLLLGGVAVAAAGLGDDDDVDPVATTSPSPSPSPSPSASPAGGPEDVLIRIPAPCVQVAQEADAAFEDVDAFAEAVRSFDARQLQDFLDRFQEVRPRIESLSEQCQSLAGEGIVDGDLITPTPAASS